MTTRMHRKSEMCLAPQDQPGDQENQGEKNRRAHSQRPYEPACVNLRKTTHCIDVRGVSSTPSARTPAMTLQKMRISEIHATAGIILKSRSCCLANRGLRACGEALAMMAYPVKKNDWAAISQESRCTIRLSSCWIWSRMVRYQSAGLSRLAAGILMRRALRLPELRRRKCVRCGLKSRTTLVQVPWRDLPE